MRPINFMIVKWESKNFPFLKFRKTGHLYYLVLQKKYHLLGLVSSHSSYWRHSWSDLASYWAQQGLNSKFLNRASFLTPKSYMETFTCSIKCFESTNSIGSYCKTQSLFSARNRLSPNLAPRFYTSDCTQSPASSQRGCSKAGS